MKNKELWKPAHIRKDASGHFIGGHMERIVGAAYEPVIRSYAKGLLADVGCGSVPYYDFYRNLVTDNICLDWGREDGEVSYLDHTVDLNNEKIPLAADSVDTVLCTDVLEHIKKPEQLFSEMARILNRGGNLILTVPFMYWVHDAPYDYHRYTRHKLIDFCEQNQLKVVSLESFGGLPEIVYDLISKGFSFDLFPLKMPLLPIWRRIGMLLYPTRLIRGISSQSKELFPLGYILVAQK
jgi:SAM-dependent methyltransferase